MTDWPNHLTADEAARLVEIDHARAELQRERAEMANRARQRKLQRRLRASSAG